LELRAHGGVDRTGCAAFGEANTLDDALTSAIFRGRFVFARVVAFIAYREGVCVFENRLVG
jgi:hypothetical protein